MKKRDRLNQTMQTPKPKASFALFVMIAFGAISGSDALFSSAFANETLTTDRASKITDLTALGFQERSITKLRKLVKQYAGTSREPELLSRLADLYLQRSGITFRVSEGTSVKTKTSLYQNSLKDGINVFSEFLHKYPYHANAANALFKRGKAYKELGKIKEARADYLQLDQTAPHFDYIDSALNDLADFAQDANQHPEALVYLGKLEKMKESEYYPIALRKTAWSYFNLANHAYAIDYLSREINFYFTRIEAKKDGAPVETAFIESAFNDLALFSFECFNKKVAGVSIGSTLDTFHKLDRSPKDANGEQHYFGTTALKLARLLKAYTLTPELETLKKALINDNLKMPQTTEVALLMFQFYFERHEYNKLPSVLSDLNEIRRASPNSELNQKMESSLSGALAELHKQVLKNKKSTELSTLTKPLFSLTSAVSDLLGSTNGTAVLANYSLAETSFEIQDYPRATQLYLGLTQPESIKVLEAKNLSAQALQLRLLSSRYRELKNDHLVPEKLEIHALTAKPTSIEKDHLNKMNEWIAWVDHNVDAIPSVSDQEKTKNKFLTPAIDVAQFYPFGVEAAKLVYQYGDTAKALARLEKLAFLTPDSEEGQSAISIVVDTVAKSEDWQRLYDLSTRILTVQTWKEKEFIGKVKDTSADAYLRITMNTQAPEEILTRTKECISKYKGTKVGLDCSLLQARTELKLAHYEIAEKQLNEILPHIKDAAKSQSLLLLRADARTKLGNFDSAIQDLSTYQNQTNYKDSAITQTILQHYWFKGDQQLDQLLKNKLVCSGSNEDACEQYRVVHILERDSRVDAHVVFRNTIKTSKSIAPLWALIALKDPKKLPFQDRLILLQRLSSHWDQVNPLVQIRLFPILQARVSDTLESIRISSPGIAPLSADPNSIERRMRLIQDVDSTFAKVMKLNWLQIKLKGVSELEQIYSRLVVDLKAINTPNDLLKPFLQKIKEVNQANQTLQEMAMNFNVPSTSAAPSRSIASVDPQAAPKTEAAPTLVLATPTDVTKILLSQEVKDRVPAPLWNEWKHGVEQSRRDFLFHLVSAMETSTEAVKQVGPILRGLVLLQSNASSEAFELIRTAEETPWKKSLVSQFVAQRTGS